MPAVELTSVLTAVATIESKLLLTASAPTMLTATTGATIELGLFLTFDTNFVEFISIVPVCCFALLCFLCRCVQLELAVAECRYNR